MEVGQAGRVCSHCKFDELQMRWELRLFSLQAHALKKSHGAVTAEDAVRKVQLTSACTRICLFLGFHCHVSQGKSLFGVMPSCYIYRTLKGEVGQSQHT